MKQHLVESLVELQFIVDNLPEQLSDRQKTITNTRFCRENRFTVGDIKDEIQVLFNEIADLEKGQWITQVRLSTAPVHEKVLCIDMKIQELINLKRIFQSWGKRSIGSEPTEEELMAIRSLRPACIPRTTPIRISPKLQANRIQVEIASLQDVKRSL